VAYAYHIQTMRDFYIALGMFGGFKQVRLDVGSITLTDFNDPAIDGRAQALVYPEITPGIWLYGKKVWAGLAIHQTLGNRIDAFGEDSRMARQVYLSAGYRHRLAKGVALAPSGLIKMGQAVPMAIDLNAAVEWQNKFALGVGYRNSDAVILMGRVSFAKYFELGYSYDVTTSRLRVASSNTHEFILGITPCTADDGKRRMISCPAFD
jgi:type IX secretion system PorP/SprF family membrane protein